MPAGQRPPRRSSARTRRRRRPPAAGARSGVLCVFAAAGAGPRARARPPCARDCRSIASEVDHGAGVTIPAAGSPGRAGACRALTMRCAPAPARVGLEVHRIVPAHHREALRAVQQSVDDGIAELPGARRLRLARVAAGTGSRGTPPWVTMAMVCRRGASPGARRRPRCARRTRPAFRRLPGRTRVAPAPACAASGQRWLTSAWVRPSKMPKPRARAGPARSRRRGRSLRDRLRRLQRPRQVARADRLDARVCERAAERLRLAQALPRRARCRCGPGSATARSTPSGRGG